MRRALKQWIDLAWYKLCGRDLENFHPHGVVVHLPKGEQNEIRHLLASGGPYEQPEADGVRDFVSSGQDVLELGGSIGVVSAVVRRQIGRQARHVIVEADPRLAEICLENASREADPGAVEVINAAVDYSGAAEVRFARGNNAHTGKLARGDEPAMAVPAMRLSELAQRMPRDGFALICDIEGAELAMVREDMAALEKVSTLILETHPSIFPGGAQDLADLLKRIEVAGLREVRQVNDVFCFRR